MRIIGIGHRQRTGKDTAAKFMLHYLRSNYSQIKSGIVPTSRRIKELACDLYSWAGIQDEVYYENHPEYMDQLLAPLGKTPRQLWLEMGYYLHEIHPSTLMELLLTNLDFDLLIIPGVRRLVEVDFIKRFNGYNINIERQIDKVENKYTGHPAYTLDSQLDDYQWDFTIDNNGTPRDLNKRVIDLTEMILAKTDLLNKDE